MELFFHFRACHQKSSFTRCFTFFERSLKSIYITGKKIVWTWNQIISLTSWPRIKNFFHKIFHFHQGVQTRKSNYFSHFLASDQKTSSTAYSPYLPRNSILIVKTGNGIIQTGNGIISPTSRPLIKKLLLQHLLHINQGFQNWFSKQEMELSKQEMEIFLTLPGLWSKHFFFNIFLIFTREFKIGL